MSRRQQITIRQIEKQVDRLNALLGKPVSAYSPADGGYKPNAGNFHTDQAYGGVGIAQMCDTGTGTRSIIPIGTKRECYEQLRSYIAGIEAAKNITGHTPG